MKSFKLYDEDFKNLLDKPVMFDANIFMIGADRRDKFGYEFDEVSDYLITPTILLFKNIYIHEEVFKELNEKSKNYLLKFVGKNITIVSEGDLYLNDPEYIETFNEIACSDIMKFKRNSHSKSNRGEMYSMAYAARHKINYLASNDSIVDIACDEIDALKNVTSITLDVVILLATAYHLSKKDKQKIKSLGKVYEDYCKAVIRRHHLPISYKDYLDKMMPKIKAIVDELTLNE